MRKFLKNSILEILKTIYEAHKIIKDFMKEENLDNAKSVLVDCQESLFQIGVSIENSEKNADKTIELINDYYKYIYEIYTNISDGTKGKEIKNNLDSKLYKIEKSIKEDIKIKLEIVFMPYKASMWDSLESIWRAADEDSDCNAYVVPIPYYDRNSDHSLGEFHYEGNEYPDYVPIVHYNAYNLAIQKPDIIYIHNPYDDCNYVTCVESRFFSINLKKYTEQLIYVPYFVLEEPIAPENFQLLDGIAHFVLSPGVINADKVIVQSENMKKAYMTILLNYFGDTEENRRILDKKILGIGSPKFDKITNISKNDYVVPDEWKRIIYKADGIKKKVVLYNTGLSALLENDIKMVRKICSVFNNFFEYKDDIALLWRPHPLIKATIESMKPHLWEAYSSLVEWYKASNWGIYDDSTDLDRAIALSDAYYGDGSSLIQLCQKKKIPIMIQNTDVLEA